MTLGRFKAGLLRDGSVGFFAFVSDDGGTTFKQTYVRRFDGQTIEDVATGVRFGSWEEATRETARLNNVPQFARMGTRGA